ncbi:hypothetical protein IQ235_08810 [Oscillatoriales cyanobacterium LEGE 11467]|uniref:Uncharacterized protein n=1 Tax=Zarconia navalis LEGE 11467 TaxID=1828826 RepID=A0A928VX35_9CYAN|nr:hypothetical protein [Zarconia navalis]MBE9040878.1 hypothetical protein [Zarconia navalis LEGE 11467]
MVKNMNELGHVEQELMELRSRMEKSFEIVDGLAQIQAQFEGLAQTYGELKQYIERAQTILENATGVEEQFDRRFGELETSLNDRWETTRGELSEIQTTIRQELETTGNQLEERVNHSLSDFKRELDEKMMTAVQESTSQGEAMQAPIKEFEVVIDQLEHRTNLIRLALRNAEEQVGTLRWIVIALAVFTVLALGGLFWFFSSQGG